MALLISHRTPQAVMAVAQGRSISALDYLWAARHMATLLPEGAPVLNLCARRHHFAVVLGAALIRGVPLLLPPTHTPETLRRLAQSYPGLSVVLDEPGDSAGLPQIRYQRGPIPEPGAPFDVPDIDDLQIAAYVFTSGSTGEPVPHAKRWGSLVRDGLAIGERLCETLPSLSQSTHGPGPRFVVTGTVPAQHMYGLESTILLPLLNDGAIDAAHPFYPADIAAAMEKTVRPRVLVSTPFHLHALVGSDMDMPPVDLVLCATAPLKQELAHQVEASLAAPLLEIYGSTETGQIATRRTSAGEPWQCYAGIKVHEQTEDGETVWIASGGHVDGNVPLGDVLKLDSATRFSLLGRRGDMINIAGKRSSLAYLNHQLTSIEGVHDGVMLWPAEDREPARVQRPVAFVVAPGLDEERLMRALRERIDPAFMPRPVHFVDRLPRNAMGKLPASALTELARQQGRGRHG